MQLTGREKATIFLSILGTETSSRILRYLPPELGEVIASSVNHLPTPTPEALGEVLNDFKSFGALPPMRAEWPASGPQAVEFTSEPGYTPATSGLSPREIIERASPKALSFILSDERPQIIAFVLSLLPEKKKDEVLSSIGSQKNLVIDLISGIKKSPFSAQVEEKLLKYFSEKLK